MSDEYNQKNAPLEAQSSDTISGTSGTPSKDMSSQNKIYIMVIALLLSGFFVRMQKLLEYNIFLLQCLQELLV